MSGNKRYPIGRILGAEAVIAGVLGLFCLLVGWPIAQAFLIVGILTLMVSFAETYAGRNEMHCTEHQYVQMTMRVIADEEQQKLSDHRHGLSFGVILGCLTIGIGFAVAVFFD